MGSIKAVLMTVDSISPLLTLHNVEHAQLTRLANTLLSPGTKFDNARAALERWRDFAKGGERWEAAREWEELVALELAGPEGDEEEEEVKPKRKGKR